MFTKNTLLVSMLLSVSSLVCAMENSEQLKNETLMPQEEVADITDETLLPEWVFTFWEDRALKDEEIADVTEGMKNFCLQKNPGKNLYCEKLIAYMMKNKLEMQAAQPLVSIVTTEVVTTEVAPSEKLNDVAPVANIHGVQASL